MVWLSACAALALAGCSTNAKGGASTVTVSGTHADRLRQPAARAAPAARRPPTCSTPSSSRSSTRAARPASSRSSSTRLDGHELSDNARTAIENTTSIAYLGELQPGTSQISVEITNQQGLLVVSPTDTAVVPDPAGAAAGRDLAVVLLPVAIDLRRDVRAGGPELGHRGEGDRRRDAGPARLAAVRRPATASRTAPRPARRSRRTRRRPA